MQLEHSFTVPLGIDEAWAFLLDADRVGPCLPGATIESAADGVAHGAVKVKLGPINLTYHGTAKLVERDVESRRAVLDLQGEDARGNGTVSANLTATLADGGARTSVTVVTDLEITGKPAQFDRDRLQDVGAKFVGRFADNIAASLGDNTPADDVPAAETAAPAARPARPKPRPTPKARPAEPDGQPVGADVVPAATEADVLSDAAAEGIAPQPVDHEETTTATDQTDATVDTAGPIDTTGPIDAAAGSADEDSAHDSTHDSTAEGLAPQPVDDAGSIEEPDAATGPEAATPSFATPSELPVVDLDSEPSVNGHSGIDPLADGPAATSRGGGGATDLMAAATPMLAKRLAPVAVALVVLLAAAARRRGRR